MKRYFLIAFLIVMQIACKKAPVDEVAFSELGFSVPDSIAYDEKILFRNQGSEQCTFWITCAGCYDDYVETIRDGKWHPVEFDQKGYIYKSVRPSKPLHKGKKVLMPGEALTLNSFLDRGISTATVRTIRIRIYFVRSDSQFCAISDAIKVF